MENGSFGFWKRQFPGRITLESPLIGRSTLMWSIIQMQKQDYLSYQIYQPTEEPTKGIKKN